MALSHPATTPLGLLRRYLASTLTPGQPHVPQHVMAAACGLSVRTWQRAERDGVTNTLSPTSRARILRACAVLGYPLRPDHLEGYAAMPEPVGIATSHEGGPLATLQAMTRAAYSVREADSDGGIAKESDGATE